MEGMVTVPVKVLVCVGEFLYTDVVRVLLGPGETRVSRKGMEPSSLGFFTMN